MKNIHPAYQPDVKEDESPSLTLVPIGGLANRFYAIMSAITFCKEQAVKLKVVWFKDAGMGSDFHAILALGHDVKNVEVVDAGWKEWRYDRPRKRNFWLPYLWQRWAFGARIYEEAVNRGFSCEDLAKTVKRNKSVYLVHYSLFCDRPDLSTPLRPVESIRQRVEERIRNFSLDKHTIGIHIRRGDHTRSRLNSPLSLFIKKIEEEIRKNPDARFYIASDDYEEKSKLKEMFGDRIIALFDKVERDNEKGIADAVVELYTLSSMKKLYGSWGSTYSILAARLSGIPIEVLSAGELQI